VAKRKTLFDDRPIEISELTYVIRQDIASLNTQIASLQSYIRAQKQPQVAAGKGQVEEHNSNVVMMLQSRLADMGMGFKDVLELRTQVSEISRSSCEERIGECDFEIVMWRQHWRSVWSEKSYEGS
jgi:syntaxin 5